MIHDLKIHPRFFDAVKNGIKTFEVRRNDRSFCVGDTLFLKEYEDFSDPLAYGYTGRVCEAFVTYILDDPHFCPEGFVILGIKLLS